MYKHLAFQRAIAGEIPAGTVEPPAEVWKIDALEGYAIVYPVLPPMIRLVNRSTENDHKYYFYVAALRAYDWNSAKKIRLPAAMWIVYTSPAPIAVDLDNFYRRAIVNAVVRTGIIPDDDGRTLSAVGDLFVHDPGLGQRTFAFVFPLDRMPSAAEIERFVFAS
ncbi:MAG: hypothetical protein HSCHL_2031 [Hydrogenibacillus schlegelii]|uniref:Uncharacterized protein n=2 Tax=Hydrogenibacillus schlegelii TaxID=1484 RepID=A0A2T5G457_HYDSH|nr:MAG: hypothetical protein HSCHL_2031 [Hydrogenibacillus schlegelii]